MILTNFVANLWRVGDAGIGIGNRDHLLRSQGHTNGGDALVGSAVEYSNDRGVIELAAAVAAHIKAERDIVEVVTARLPHVSIVHFTPCDVVGFGSKAKAENGKSKEDLPFHRMDKR